ncbi:type VI secretion system tip protein VgrG [Vibrio cholerae]|uniref:type VI secretion system tip protein TssI/VgrG n=1 Tax=Vibrio cholerae TaxID=666 RepID=UPI001A348567|nr:type VI secretion system tip protein VgrG [Vibrio cholerae]HAS3560361.1 type VI secretion system tip protein VgrG [Vibrio cholerae]HAS3589848.1 type VI secretion system tip protein VgrG [Vibrio cholerae]
MARLQFQLKVDGLEDESLVVRGFEGQESLSDSVWRSEPCYGFRYQVDLASALSNLVAEQFVDQTAHLTILRDGQVVQQINGIVRQFSKGDTGHRHTFYSLTLVPALERLSLRSNSRIFQQQSVPEIISILLQEMGIEDYAFALKRECAQREFCVQYRETDLQFLHRIAAEEGLVYSYLHEAQKHTLLFTDSSDSQPKLAKPVPYNALAGGEINLPYVVDLQFKTTAQVSHTELKDYSFKKPAYGFTQRTQGKDIAYQQPNYEHFDAPGRYKDDANGKAFSQIRLEYLRRDALLADAKSDEPLLLAGVRFDLQDHLDLAMNRDWLVVQANHQGTQPQALQEEGGAGATTYSNQLKLIPAHITWRARPCAKPQVDGPMIATVVGPQGEEIYCDNFGRVKVHFPWDRYSSSNEKSSCWVRVAQEWAGSQYGSMAIPRVGHEVIVSFLNGDPDQPIITGRTYHATNTAPYALPDHKTKTVLRTETHQGQGYNELSFEDQAGSEQILLHAQKDWDALIEHDHTEVIRHDQHLTVDNDRFTRIQRNQHLTVEGEVRSKIALDSSHEVGASLQHKVGQRIAVEAGKEISLKSGAKIVVEAGAELTLKAGGSFVKVDAGGVHLVGPAINLNAGGSAGSGSAYGGQLAAAPRMLAQAKPVAELVQPDIAASMQSGAARVIDVASLPTMMPSSANNTANDEPVAEEKTPDRILKSDLLKPSDELEKLAKRQASAYRQGNHSDEVKLLQEALMKLGFDLGKAGADGDFGGKTKTAIEQFQKSYQPSHQTHPSYSIGPVDGIVGNGTLLALDEALMDGWVYENDEMDLKWLTVPKGQLTFDAEGNDVDSSTFFSRKVHVPNMRGSVIGNSGVTIGRGLDLGNPPSAASGQTPSKINLKELFELANLNPKLSKWLLSVEGKTKDSALESLKNSGLSDEELTITRKQQYIMFNHVYDYLEEKTRVLITKPDVKAAYGSVDWDGMPRNVKDVLVDITYRGDSYSKTRAWYVPTLVNDRNSVDYSNFKKSLDYKNSIWDKVPLSRKRVRYEHL